MKTMKSKFIEIALRIVIAALTASLTAVTTTSCMGYGPSEGGEKAHPEGGEKHDTLKSPLSAVNTGKAAIVTGYKLH